MASRIINPIVDVLIIGGGPAGLSAALNVARQQHSAVLFDSKQYRNERTSHMHAFLAFDHVDPKAFRAQARENILARYTTIHFADVAVSKVTRLDDDDELFEAVDATGKQWQGRKLVLATGVIDVYPNIPGFDECWAHGIFHCLFCDGYEERHSGSSGILAFEENNKTPALMHIARSAAHITPDKVTIYTSGATDLAQELRDTLAAGKPSPITVDSRRIARLEKGPNDAQVIIHFEDGSSTMEGFLVYHPKNELRSPFAKQLGLELTPSGDIQTTPPFGETSVKGVFAAGDIVSPLKAVSNAVATGQVAAAGILARLQASKWNHQSLF